MASQAQAPSHFKPGKTINKHERHFVVHNYHDYANEPDDPAKTPIRRRKGGVTTPFPVVLHRTLAQIEEDGLNHIFGWQPHGRCFVIFKPKEFVDTVMPRYFKLGKLSSFQRQLNLYGFNRITRGLDSTGYYHEYFLRDREYLAKRILRKRIKGTKIKGATNPDLEPDFYTMPPVGPHPDPSAPVFFTPSVVTSDDASQDASSQASVPSSDDNDMAIITSSSMSTAKAATKPVCNFVFPNFQMEDESDPLDDLLQSFQGSSNAEDSTDKLILKDWESQDALLGQYLVLDEEDGIMEAV